MPTGRSAILASSMGTKDALVVLDYGSQYTQFFARLSREMGVYSVILPFDAPTEKIKAHNPLGVVLSGGPSSVFDEGAPHLNPDILDFGVPILGVCYGQQLLAQHFGGTVEPAKIREYGRANIQLLKPGKLIPKKADCSTVWMSHGTHVSKVSDKFTITAMSGGTIAAFEDVKDQIFGVQFHLEVAHTEHGQAILENF